MRESFPSSHLQNKFELYFITFRSNLPHINGKTAILFLVYTLFLSMNIISTSSTQIIELHFNNMSQWFPQKSDIFQPTLTHLRCSTLMIEPKWWISVPNSTFFSLEWTNFIIYIYKHLIFVHVYVSLWRSPKKFINFWLICIFNTAAKMAELCSKQHIFQPATNNLYC